MKLIQTNNIVKKYGHKIVLDHVNLTINEGEIIGIVGANGSGKTTLIEIIAKIINPSSGTISYKEDFKIEQELGIQFQEGYWPKGVTSKSIIKYFVGYFTNVSKSEWINNLIDIFEIKSFMNKDLNELSGGQKQRLNALLAIVKNPKLIVLDELITGLDSKMQKKLSEFFKTIVEQNPDKTLITISHIPEEVELFCKRLILLSDGKIFYDDSVENILNKYGSIRNFLNIYYKSNLESNLELSTNSNNDSSNNSFFKRSFKKLVNKFNNFIKFFTDFSPRRRTDFKIKANTWLKNFILLFLSTFKNFRTYVYVIIIPIGLSLGLYYISTYTEPSMFPPSRVAGFLLIPSFSIILLINTLVSEWKASIFLKRIKVSGTSKTQFLSSIWAVGLVLGFISFLLNLSVYMIYGSVEQYGYDWIYQCLDLLGTNGYIGLICSALFIAFISMGISTLLAGSISSIGISQSIGILITVLFIATSDVFLPTTMLGQSKIVVFITYFIPTKYPAWLSIITTNGANLNWASNARFIFNTDDALISSTYTYSFTTIIWPIIGSFAWIVILFFSSTFTFRWSSKK